MIDTNATNFIKIFLQYAGVNFVYHSKYDLNALGTMYAPWQNQESVNDLATRQKTSAHNQKSKETQFEKVKNDVLNNQYTDTTIFAARPNDQAPILIIDGIHRAVGIQRAILQDPNIKSKINLRVFLIVGDPIKCLEDYQKSIPQQEED
jgi:hypothetical protein